MKKKYTKKQITEAIAYWQKRLNEEFIQSKTQYVEPRHGEYFLVSDLIELLGKADAVGKSNAQICGLLSNDDSDLASESNSIGGFVNDIYEEDGVCILTLAPYRNGQRYKDLSINLKKPLDISKMLDSIGNIDKNDKVAVKMKDPYGFGPKAGQILTAPVFAGKITSKVYEGIFLYISTERATAEKQYNESNEVHDRQVHDETELILDIPNMPPVDVEFEGEWHGVRFAIDLFTDALAHMRAKDPAKYGDVKFHVKH